MVTISYISVSPARTSYTTGETINVYARLNFQGIPGEGYIGYVGLTIRSPSNTEYYAPLGYFYGTIGANPLLNLRDVLLPISAPAEIGYYDIISCVWDPDDVSSGVILPGSDPVVCYPGTPTVWSYIENVFQVTAPTTGDIRVNSSPTGAKIYIDGSYTGKTTNNTVSSITGLHILGLVKEGYEPYSATITVLPGSVTLPTVTLSPLGTLPPPPPGTGGVYITSIPSGAQIYVDGAAQGRQTPYTVYATPGTHQIELRMTGFETFRQTVSAVEDETIIVTGVLQTVTVPPGGEISNYMLPLVLGGAVVAGVAIYYLTKGEK